MKKKNTAPRRADRSWVRLLAYFSIHNWRCVFPRKYVPIWAYKYPHKIQGLVRTNRSHAPSHTACHDAWRHGRTSVLHYRHNECYEIILASSGEMVFWKWQEVSCVIPIRHFILAWMYMQGHYWLAASLHIKTKSRNRVTYFYVDQTTQIQGASLEIWAIVYTCFSCVLCRSLTVDSQRCFMSRANHKLRYTNQTLICRCLTRQTKFASFPTSFSMNGSVRRQVRNVMAPICILGRVIVRNRILVSIGDPHAHVACSRIRWSEWASRKSIKSE